MKIYNNTDRTVEEIQAMPVVGKMVSKWSERNITLYRDELDRTNRVFSIGITFDERMMVLAYEDIGMNYAIALDYWVHGQKTYVRE